MNDLRRAEHAAKMEEQGGTCYGEAEVYENSGKFEHEKNGYQKRESQLVENIFAGLPPDSPDFLTLTWPLIPCE